jgi:hypothetical protein
VVVKRSQKREVPRVKKVVGLRFQARVKMLLVIGRAVEIVRPREAPLAPRLAKISDDPSRVAKNRVAKSRVVPSREDLHSRAPLAKRKAVVNRLAAISDRIAQPLLLKFQLPLRALAGPRPANSTLVNSILVSSAKGISVRDVNPRAMLSLLKRIPADLLVGL